MQNIFLAVPYRRGRAVQPIALPSLPMCTGWSCSPLRVGRSRSTRHAIANWSSTSALAVPYQRGRAVQPPSFRVTLHFHLITVPYWQGRAVQPPREAGRQISLSLAVPYGRGRAVQLDQKKAAQGLQVTCSPLQAGKSRSTI